MEMMKIKVITLTLILLAGKIFSQQTAEQVITLETETGNIEGTLLLPSVSEEVPIILIIAGSGPTDRNGNNPMMINNSLKMLAEGMLENGVASLRYDKRGIGKSRNAGLKESDLRFEDYIEDAEKWVNLLEKDNRFSEIIILGHSEGSLIGMIAAQKENVNKFISIAGVGVTAGEILKKQLKSQPSVVLDQSLPIIEKLEEGKTVEDVPQMLYSLFRPSVQPYLISWFKYDPQKEIAKLNIPILIVQGTTDVQVGVSDAENLAMANKKAEKQIIKGMNHVLKEAEADRQKNLQTYSVPDLPLQKDLIDIIVKFVIK